MKTLFTFTLILSFLISSYAQKSIGKTEKSGIQPYGILAPNQSFSIIKSYPNPVKDFVTIELRSEVSGAIQIRLLNILGTEVKKWDSFFLDQGDQKLKIDLSSFKIGVYILKISKSDQVRSQILKKN